MSTASRNREYLSTELQTLFVLIVLLLVVTSEHKERETPEKIQSNEVFIDGDVLIGGMSQMHLQPGERNRYLKPCEQSLSPPCRDVFVRGIIPTEAMLFAMDKINENTTLLPGITLGINIRDSCNSIDYAIQQTLKFNFVRDPFTHDDFSKDCRSRNESKLIAIVGSIHSGITMAVASLAGLFQVPVVSYASSSRLLQDRERFKYFLRTVPSDNLQVKALVDIVDHFQWRYIITIASDTEYGRSGMASFHNLLKVKTNGSVCVAVDALVAAQTPHEEMNEIFKKIKLEPSANVIVLFADSEDANYFVRTAKKHNLTGYTWLASDGWSNSDYVTDGHEDILKNMIGTTPEFELNKEFLDYFANVTRTRLSRNPILKKYETRILEITGKDSSNLPFITPTINAMFAVAYGLHQLYNCTNRECPQDAVQNADYTQLYNHIKNVSFRSQAGRPVRFDTDNAVFNIIKFKAGRTEGRSHFVKVGKWSASNKIRLNIKNITMPLSIYSTPCSRGHRKKLRLTKHPECCWECLPCPHDKYTNTINESRCMECPKGFRVSSNRSSCSPQPMTYLLFSNPFALALFGYSCLGSLAVFITWVVYHMHRTTPIIKASSYELSCLLLLALLWNFVTPIVSMLPATRTFCTVNLSTASTGICLFFITLITKVNRIARVFSRKAFQSNQVNYFTMKWQFAIILLFCSINIMIIVVWYALTKVRLDIVEYAPGSLTTVCKYSDVTGAFVLLAYHVGLLIVCTYQAFLIRKVPENYNEAKFISFTTLVISFGILMYVPGHQGLRGNHRTLLACLLYLFCNTIALVCLFGPKVHIIIFRPTKNISMTTPPRSPIYRTVKTA